MELMSDTELRRKAFNILFKELGEINTVRFLSQIICEKKDYMELQDALFKDMTIDEIYEKARDYEKQRYAVS
jgi:hypothetical protein